MDTLWRWRWGVLACCCLTAQAWAGGSGLNVVVVVNQNSSNSVQLGNYYCELRQVPPQNYLRVNWAGGNVNWGTSDFNTYLLNPLLAMLSSRQLTNQIDYVLISMDIPYRVTNSASVAINSTTSTLFYGFKSDPNPPCSLATGSTSLYAGSEGVFRATPPINANSNSFLVTMITASNLPQAELVVSQGVASDGTFPTQTVYLADNMIDPARNVRYALFDNAIFNARLRGNYSMQRISSYGIPALGSILGAQTGAYNYGISGFSFVPGGMADNLDSFGGFLFQDNGAELDVLALLVAGAAGTYGTVDEPCNYLEKFPTPQNYFYQARGFSLAESYYQSVTNPYQGLVLGEPLAAPFEQPASGGWTNLPANALLSGATNLSVQFSASDAQHPIQKVDLFVDGTFAQTLTNIAPAQGNQLSVTLNGFMTSYTVSAAATISSVASNLTASLNAPLYSTATKVAAFLHGDRIELQSLDSTKAGLQVPVLLSAALGIGSSLTTFVGASRANFLDTIAFGRQTFTVNNEPKVGDYLQLAVTKTNGSVVTLAVTNLAPGTNVSTLTQQLINLVNTNAALQSSDGVTAEEFLPGDTYGLTLAQFDLVANTAGWNAAQIQANLSGPATFSIQPIGTPMLEGNLADLQPRNQLYITAGVTNLALTFAFNTTTQANGYHDLTAIAYEGSHVRTQRRVTQTVQIQNSALSAALTTLLGGGNTLVSATLQFSVVANTNNVAQIQLFSTGGLLAAVSNQSSAVFSVPGTNLELGLHPFYALVTTTTGQQYRTQTQWIRLIDSPDSPFAVALTTPPPTLSWPATAGRTYNILSATNLGGASNLAKAFQVTATVTPTNTTGQWTDTNAPEPQRFYRVQTAD